LANTRRFVWIGRSVNRGYNDIGLLLGGIQSTGPNIVADKALMLLYFLMFLNKKRILGFAAVSIFRKWCDARLAMTNPSRTRHPWCHSVWSPLVFLCGPLKKLGQSKIKLAPNSP
jgi:hypothetical protein